MSEPHPSPFPTALVLDTSFLRTIGGTGSDSYRTFIQYRCAFAQSRRVNFCLICYFRAFQDLYRPLRMILPNSRRIHYES